MYLRRTGRGVSSQSGIARDTIHHCGMSNLAFGMLSFEIYPHGNVDMCVCNYSCHNMCFQFTRSGAPCVPINLKCSIRYASSTERALFRNLRMYSDNGNLSRGNNLSRYWSCIINIDFLLTYKLESTTLTEVPNRIFFCVCKESDL